MWRQHKGVTQNYLIRTDFYIHNRLVVSSTVTSTGWTGGDRRCCSRMPRYRYHWSWLGRRGRVLTYTGNPWNQSDANHRARENKNKLTNCNPHLFTATTALPSACVPLHQQTKTCIGCRRSRYQTNFTKLINDLDRVASIRPTPVSPV